MAKRRGSGLAGGVWGALMALAALMPATVARAAPPSMEFSVLTQEDCKGTACAKILLGEGEIERDTYRAFLRAAGKLKPGTALILNSPGGEVSGAILLGMAIRGAGFDTLVPSGAICNSACAYAFLGGVSRVVLNDGRLGVHRSRHQLSNGDKLPPDVEREVDAEVTQKLKTYVTSMGVSAAMLKVADRISSNQIRYLTPKEIASYGVVKGKLHLFGDPAKIRRPPRVWAPDGTTIETRAGP